MRIVRKKSLFIRIDIKSAKSVENKIVKSGGPPQQNEQQPGQQPPGSGVQSDMMPRDMSQRGMINVTADSKVLDFLGRIFPNFMKIS